MTGPGPESGRPKDLLEGDPRIRAHFGDRYSVVEAYARLLTTKGVEWGVIGPRESGRLWERHLLNCAAVVPFLAPGPVVDVGSGAGLPGIVIAAMEPEREVVLIESMARRATWLGEAVEALRLPKVEVIRARAEELRSVQAPTVVARAVAPLSRLLTLCGGLVAEGGEMLFLKGRLAGGEIGDAAGDLKRRGLSAEVLEAPTIEGVQAATVVRVRPIIGRAGEERLES